MMDCARTALINVDLQNCFVEGSPISAPGGRAVLDKINRLTQACRAAGVLIIHAAHVLRPDGSNSGVLGAYPFVRDGFLNKGSHSAALHDALNVAEGDILLEKPRYGAFHGTDLELLLRSRGIDTLIISGIATNVCCETTAREAAVRDFKVVFMSDATATFPFGDISAEELQKTTCATIGMVFGRVLTVEELLSEL